MSSPSPTDGRPKVRNPFRDADASELALYRAAPRNRAVFLRFALHVLERDPESIWARVALADAATGPERLGLLKEACEVGWALWSPCLRDREPVDWWGDRDTRPLMIALMSYGLELAGAGEADKATAAFKVQLHLDPTDRMAAEAAFARVGIVAERAGSPWRPV